LQIVRFGRLSREFDELGVRVYALSHDSPASHAAWAEQLNANGHLGSQQLLSDWNSEASRAFGVYRDELIGMRPLNVRGAFLVDGDSTLRYSWTSDDLRELPDPQPVVAAARALS
jgi:alkyl hydroperoxide reductase subunit AhpC